MGNSLTDALRFKKSIGAPTKGLYPPKTANRYGADAATSGLGRLSFHKTKVPNLGGSKAGDAITVRVHGSVHSVDPNGNMTMHVSDIKPDSDEMTGKQYPDQKKRPAGLDRAH